MRGGLFSCPIAYRLFEDSNPCLVSLGILIPNESRHAAHACFCFSYRNLVFLYQHSLTSQVQYSSEQSEARPSGRRVCAPSRSPA